MSKDPCIFYSNDTVLTEKAAVLQENTVSPLCVIQYYYWSAIVRPGTRHTTRSSIIPSSSRVWSTVLECFLRLLSCICVFSKRNNRFGEQTIRHFFLHALQTTVRFYSIFISSARQTIYQILQLLMLTLCSRGLWNSAFLPIRKFPSTQSMTPLLVTLSWLLHIVEPMKERYKSNTEVRLPWKYSFRMKCFMFETPLYVLICTKFERFTLASTLLWTSYRI